MEDPKLKVEKMKAHHGQPLEQQGWQEKEENEKEKDAQPQVQEDEKNKDDNEDRLQQVNMKQTQRANHAQMKDDGKENPMMRSQRARQMRRPRAMRRMARIMMTSLRARQMRMPRAWRTRRTRSPRVLTWTKAKAWRCTSESMRRGLGQPGLTL